MQIHFFFISLFVKKQNKKTKKSPWIDWFYGISNIAGYLMPNPLYTYTLNMICPSISMHQ